MISKSTLIAGTAIFLLGFGIADLAASTVRKYPPLFGTRERHYDDIKVFQKWTEVLERYESMKSTDGKPCDPFFHDSCELQPWPDFLLSIEGKTTPEKITAVNDYQNQAKYLTDPVNWKVEDYWEVPHEFFARNGDCEDYAIAKYLSLRKIGFAPSDMRIVVVQDLNLNVGHAILVVYHEDNALILDNQIDQVLNAEKIKHYKIQYSINENGWWRHR